MPRTDFVGLLNFRQSPLVRMIACRRTLTTQTPGHIDDFGFVDGVGLVGRFGNADIPYGAPCFVRGWAVDLGRRRVPWDIRIEIDGKVVPASVRRNGQRLDIARTFEAPALASSGFTALVSTKGLNAGPHVLRLRAIVGRYAVASARLPVTIRFFILKQYPTAFAPPLELADTTTSCSLDPLVPTPVGEVFALSGSARDEHGRPFAGLAAQIDDGRWSEGWPTDKTGGFYCRIRLDSVKPGLHLVRLAGRTGQQRWALLGETKPFVVTSRAQDLPCWAGALTDPGEAFITDDTGQQQTRLLVYRVRGSVAVTGRLRRRSPIGLPVGLVALASDGVEFKLPAWSAPTDDPQTIHFGAEIGERALLPGTYRLLVDAPDPSQRFVGRSDTGCELVVKRRPPLPSET